MNTKAGVFLLSERAVTGAMCKKGNDKARQTRGSAQGQWMSARCRRPARKEVMGIEAELDAES